MINTVKIESTLFLNHYNRKKIDEICSNFQLQKSKPGKTPYELTVEFKRLN